MLSRSQTPADEKDRIAAHFAGHQILIDELPPGHPYRNVQLRGSPRYFGEYLILCALMPGFYEEATPGPVIEKELEFHRHMIEALIANGESDRLLAWRSANNTLTGWLDQLAGRGHIAEALDLTTRLIAISKDRPQSGLVDRRTRFAQLLKIEPPATPVVATPRIEPAWEAYELQPIHFGFPFTAPAGGGRSVVFTVTDGNLLYSLRAAPQQPYYGANLELDPTLDCELTIHWLPSGELLERIGIAFGATAKPKLYAATLLHGILYVGTDLGLGAIDLQAKRWRLITRQNGLPGRSVRALGRFANRLYLGIGPDPLTGKGDDQSVFAVYDPPSAKFQIIASEKSVDTAIPWNGKRFLLDDIYPDESHGCLWLKDRQLGVWKFTPATSQFAPVLPAGKRVLLPGSRYVGQAPDIAHGTDSGWPVSFFIPEDQTQLDLPGGIDGIAIIHQSHQAVRDANFVLVSAHGLPFDRSPAGFFYLIKHGTGPAILRHTPDGKPFPSIIHLQPSSAGIVAVATNGDGFVIRRKAAAQTYRLAELQAASGNQQETKLLVAAADGRAAEVDQLLAAGTNINASDRRGWTALYHAINQQHPEIALQLLHRGAECQRSARGGSSPVSIAAEKNDVSVLKELLARHAPVESINTDGDTPLMLAAARGSVAAAELLLAVGADVNRRQPTGLHNTVLMIAIENGQLDAVKLLVLHGAAVESVNQLRNTPLILATIHGEVAILKFLREHGADVNADGQYAFTPLMHAANQSQLLAAQYLVEAGADVNRTQSDGTSALMVAAQFASPEMVQFLVDHGANVNATGQFGRTAMSWASYRNRLEIMNILRKAGAADLQEKKP
ncbi:ankyrin repeat domain-containing protein [bacterium]|nr:ankyrin repeat domain-containing protein [bacterium]